MSSIPPPSSPWLFFPARSKGTESLSEFLQDAWIGDRFYQFSVHGTPQAYYKYKSKLKWAWGISIRNDEKSYISYRKETLSPECSAPGERRCNGLTPIPPSWVILASSDLVLNGCASSVNLLIPLNLTSFTCKTWIIMAFIYTAVGGISWNNAYKCLAKCLWVFSKCSLSSFLLSFSMALPRSGTPPPSWIV